MTNDDIEPKDTNHGERLRKEFQRKGDYIHANNSLWGALITLNGIIIAIATLSPVCKTQIVLVIAFCSFSIILLVINYYTSRTYLFNKIEYLNTKNRGGNVKNNKNKQKKGNNAKSSFHMEIRQATLWKEVLSLVFSAGAFAIVIVEIINKV